MDEIEIHGDSQDLQLLVFNGVRNLLDDLLHCFLVDLKFFAELVIYFRVLLIVFKFGHAVFGAVLEVDYVEEGAFYSFVVDDKVVWVFDRLVHAILVGLEF